MTGDSQHVILADLSQSFYTAHCQTAFARFAERFERDRAVLLPLPGHEAPAGRVVATKCCDLLAFH